MSPRHSFPLVPPPATPAPVLRARRLAGLRLAAAIVAGWVVALALLEPVGRAVVRLFGPG